MRPVGIIANPASGKDIRRLVAFGSVSSNSEKTNIVRRVLLGLDAAGVETVFLMPDGYGIGRRALGGLDLGLEVVFLDMPIGENQDDSTHAAALMADLGAACVIVLGGDGTNRVVAKAGRATPLVSIATGTNNVFSRMVEGTLAGMAAGVVARKAPDLDGIALRAPRLEIWRGEELLDIALVDVVVSSLNFVAARAIWDVATLKEVFLTQADPGNIGFSSLGGYLHPMPPRSGRGLYIRVGPGQVKVKAPIAPGLVRWVSISRYQDFQPGQAMPIDEAGAVIALDGEREISKPPGERLTVKLNPQGPWTVDLTQALRCAAQECLFRDGPNAGASLDEPFVTSDSRPTAEEVS